MLSFVWTQKTLQSFGSGLTVPAVVTSAVQDGLDAPPEEFPAQGALEDEDDLPIEALMDEDEEDEDLSLAALLRRQMLMKEGHQDASSSSKVCIGKLWAHML